MNERASPEGSARTAADVRLKKARSSVMVIGAVSLTVLLVGGSIALFAIMAGRVVPSTAALVVVIATIAVTLVAVISAVAAVRKVSASEGEAAADTGAGGSDEGPDPEPAHSVQPSDELFSATSGAQREPSPRREPQTLEVFSSIASRLQAKVSRAFVDLDALERRIEDPELLATVFSLDHLITRIRREVENLSVLGGDTPPARSGQAAEVNQVLRLAVASTEDYQRIMTFPLRGVKIHGHLVAELINILAELLDNATSFTPPTAPKIALTASRVAAGLAIEVHDRGIGMPPEDIERVNRLLAGYTDVDLRELLGQGRIGFAVVNKLAPRHNIRVQLRTNIFGGIDAAVVVPHNLLIEPEEVYGVARRRAGSGRPELGASSPSSPALPRRKPHSASQPDEWPWPPPAGAGEGSADWPPNGRHSRPGAVAGSAAYTPSPFPRSRVRGSDDIEEGLGSAHEAPVAPTVEQAVPTAAAPSEERPPLPQRGSETYLRPELREPPKVARVSAGHNPDLLIEVARGREHAELENSDGGQ